MISSSKKIKNSLIEKNEQEAIYAFAQKSQELMKNTKLAEDQLTKTMNGSNHHEIASKTYELHKNMLTENAKIAEELQNILNGNIDEETKKNISLVKEHVEQLTKKYEELQAKKDKVKTEKEKKKEKKDIHDLEKKIEENKNSVNTNTSHKKTGFLEAVNMSDVARKITTAVLAALQEVVPPEFCWKQGADFGIIPTDCPQGMFRSLALCYDHCPASYTYVAGVCWAGCASGSTDIGAMCVGGGHFYFKHSYISRSLTNFDPTIPCPPGMYKGGALCYRDCRNIGMSNCGIGACSREASSCVSSIFGMAVAVITGLVDAALFIVSLGTSTALTAAKAGLKKLGKGVIKQAMNGLKKYASKLGKDVMIKKVKELAKKKMLTTIKESVKDSVKELMKDKIVEGMVTQIMSRDTTNFDEIGFLKKLDIFGVSNIVTNCSNAGDSTDNAISCAGSVLTSISAFDPTGLTSIAAAFMQPICDVPAKITEDTQRMIDLEKNNDNIVDKNVKVRCVKMFSECDFKGESIDVCRDTQPNNTISFDKWKNKVASIIVGKGSIVGLSDTGVDDQIKTGNSNEIILQGGQTYPCLKTQFGDKFHKTSKLLQFDINRCVYFYEKPDFQGRKEIVGGNRDLRLLSGIAQSYSFISSGDIVVTAFDEKNFGGNKIVLKDVKNNDFSKIQWNNKIKSIKIESFPADDCVILSTDCNYEGYTDMVCSNYDFKGRFSNNVSSVKVGKNLKKVFMMDHDGKNSKYLELKGGDSIPCLTGHASGMDNLTSVFRLNGENCVQIYSQANYKGDSKIMCKTSNIGDMAMQVNSVKWIATAKQLVRGFENENSGGEYYEFTESVPDLSKVSWGNKFKSIQIFGENGEV